MAEEVKSLGNDLIFEEYSATAIARCIAAVCADLAGLRARAAAHIGNSARSMVLIV